MRKQNWESILSDYLERQRAKSFRRGVNDCVLFAAKGVAAMIEEDVKPIIKTVGRYNKEQADKIIDEHGGSISGIFDKYLLRRKNNLQAKRGDVVLINYNGEEVAGLVDCSGRRVACKSAKGLEFFNISEILACWDIEGVKWQ